MTTDELLEKLPSHIGHNKILDKDGKDWLAFYGTKGEFVCLNPDAEKPPYNNAFVYGRTPNEAPQGLYDWCIKNGFIIES